MDKQDISYEKIREELLGNYSEGDLKFFEEIIKESELYQADDNMEYKFVIKEDGSNG